MIVERGRNYEEYIGVYDHSLGEMSIQQGQQMILPFRLNMFDVGEAKPQNLHKDLLVFFCNVFRMHLKVKYFLGL